MCSPFFYSKSQMDKAINDAVVNTRKELDRWKAMAQRHNQSCCCQIDENNGDPKMIEPCAFHAEWRDTALESLRKKALAMSDRWNTESNLLDDLLHELDINDSAEKHGYFIQIYILRRCCDDLRAAVDRLQG